MWHKKQCAYFGCILPSSPFFLPFGWKHSSLFLLLSLFHRCALFPRHNFHRISFFPSHFPLAFCLLFPSYSFLVHPFMTPVNIGLKGSNVSLNFVCGWTKLVMLNVHVVLEYNGIRFCIDHLLFNWLTFSLAFLGKQFHVYKMQLYNTLGGCACGENFGWLPFFRVLKTTQNHDFFPCLMSTVIFSSPFDLSVLTLCVSSLYSPLEWSLLWTGWEKNVVLVIKSKEKTPRTENILSN